MNQPAHTCEETLRRVLLLCRCTAEGTVPAEVREEAARTAAALAECGLEAEIRGMTPGWEENCWPDRETLCLCDSPAAAAELIGRGAAVAGWSHAGNRGEHFADVGYLLEEPDQVDRDSYEKIWQRERHLPWTILETERCLVREFVPGDLEAIRSLYGLAENDEPYLLLNLSGDGRTGMTLSSTGIHLADGRGGSATITWADLAKTSVGYQRGMLVIGQSGITSTDAQVLAALLQQIQQKIAQ